MEFILVIFAPISIAALLAIIVLSFVKSPASNYNVIQILSKNGTRSVLHHNSSYKVSDCMESAKKTLTKHGINVDCRNFVQKY